MLMEVKHFEKYQYFLQKRKMNKNIGNLQNYDLSKIYQKLIKQNLLSTLI